MRKTVFGKKQLQFAVTVCHGAFRQLLKYMMLSKPAVDVSVCRNVLGADTLKLVLPDTSQQTEHPNGACVKEEKRRLNKRFQQKDLNNQRLRIYQP